MKKIFLLFLLLFLSGCSIKYDLTIKGDLSINEDIKVVELKSVLNRYVASVEDYVQQNFSYFRTNEEYKIYNIVDDSKDGYAVGSISKGFASLEDYCNNSTAKNTFFKECEVTKDGNLITLSMKAVDYNQYLFSSELEESIIRKAVLNIEIPYKVVSNNANYKEKNVYSWEYTIEDYSNDVNIVFDTSKVYRNINYSILILGGIIVIVIIGGIYVYRKYQENNKY